MTIPLPLIPCWQRFEREFSSSISYTNPTQDVEITVTFAAPSGRTSAVGGFWDGGDTWRVRFAPDEIGHWSYRTNCSDEANRGLHALIGDFDCDLPAGATSFEQHGPIRLSENRHYLIHADSTPFFFMADTAWNGPLRATMDDWQLYLHERVRQHFTAVQWVTTQWVAAPDGDWLGEKAFSSEQSITINPAFFQRLDAKMDAINDAGLLSVPVLLWTAGGPANEVARVNPGYVLSEDQAILLAQYMVNRWSAHNVLWILPGDSDYRGSLAERWKRIGRAVFGDKPHAPVSLHPGGMHWNLDEFRDEEWLDIIGYQSGHGDGDKVFSWLVAGPPATTWRIEPLRPFINLEPPYENHLAYHSRLPHDAHSVRRGLYWSLLVSPTAGVTYGGHGIWGWDDGTQPPVNHPTTGVPLAWQKALRMEAAEQIPYLTALFEPLDWWTLIPAPELLIVQPGDSNITRFITGARSVSGDLAVIYLPEAQEIELCLTPIQADVSVRWYDPRTGQWFPARFSGTWSHCRIIPPAGGDWLLVCQPTGTTARLGSAHNTTQENL